MDPKCIVAYAFEHGLADKKSHAMQNPASVQHEAPDSKNERNLEMCTKADGSVRPTLLKEQGWLA